LFDQVPYGFFFFSLGKKSASSFEPYQGA